MKHNLTLTAAGLALVLAACGSESSNTESAPAAPKEAEQAAPSATESTVEKVKEAAKETVAKVAESLKLDTSSMEAFKSSLGDMKASLSADQQSQLTGALKSLAKGSLKEKGGLLGAAKGLAEGKSTEEILYEKMQSKLDGLSFDDILALAK